MTTQQTDQDALREQVRARYAAAATKVTGGQGDCGCGQPADCGCDSGCCGGAATAEEPGFGAELYAALDRDQLPDTAVLASLGCGNPTAVAELHEGETVLDLGSGGGIDVLLSAKRVGPTGKAYGLDMTEEMLALARAQRRRGRRHQRRVPERPHRGHPPARRDRRRGHLQLCRQPVDRQAGGVRRDLPGPQAWRAHRHHRRRRRGPALRRGPGRAGRLGRLHRRRPLQAEYEAGLAAAGFADISVTFTHQVGDGLHSAIIKATRPADGTSTAAWPPRPSRAPGRAAVRLLLT